MTKYEFYHSTLNDLLDYDEAYRLRRIIEDEQAYFAGVYTFEAVTIALSNAFKKKGAKATEYRRKSILAEMEENNRPLTEDEIKKHTDDLFARLCGMQASFEASKGGGA